jgi:hypothetical protein
MVFRQHDEQMDSEIEALTKKISLLKRVRGSQSSTPVTAGQADGNSHALCEIIGLSTSACTDIYSVHARRNTRQTLS